MDKGVLHPAPKSVALGTRGLATGGCLGLLCASGAPNIPLWRRVVFLQPGGRGRRPSAPVHEGVCAHLVNCCARALRVKILAGDQSFMQQLAEHPARLEGRACMPMESASAASSRLIGCWWKRCRQRRPAGLPQASCAAWSEDFRCCHVSHEQRVFRKWTALLLPSLRPVVADYELAAWPAQRIHGTAVSPFQFSPRRTLWGGVNLPSLSSAARAPQRPHGCSRYPHKRSR